MPLARLLNDLSIPPDLLIHNLHEDSRLVKPGDAFLCMPRANTHQQAYCEQALALGAKAIIMIEEQHTPPANDHEPPYFTLKNLAQLGDLLRRWFHTEYTATHCIGTTGTDGKTSITWMIREILERLHGQIWSSGTLGWVRNSHEIEDIGNTTASLLNNHRLLAAAHRHHIEALVMEVSSHGIEQQRIAGIPFQSAIWSSIGHDHLEDHGGYANYLAIKASFIAQVLAHGGVAICNADHADIRTHVKPGKKVYWYAHHDHPHAVDLRWKQLDKHSMEIQFTHRTLVIENIPAGQFHAENLAAATLLLCTQWHLPLDDIPFVLNGITAPKGRMQAVTVNDWQVYIDYAHTPEALQRSLLTAKAWTQGRLMVLFGCGGNRDKQKRSIMGEVAANHADIIWLTNDNPRHENPHDILAHIQQGISAKPPVHIIPDREMAIADAILQMREGDMLLIAGKGHEEYMEIGDVRLPWSDAVMAKKYLLQKKS
ncbi:MAG: UDP-N-acetylmuramoyl-L-alanyl-D-glutamate--2,6-diaminopimelate ligase [Zetaproteobacteria bacterium]|nr:UDP-N-acetylmuramoyl-L-alanyl-D-glutamate--2,6-diaminopimelate ligase [Zetaproteobacteria bacterium]